MKSPFSRLQIFVALSLTTFCVLCHPETSSSAPINVEDTDDEFIIKKPDSKDPAYAEFFEELHRHDEDKSASKSKRSAEEGNDHEKLTVEAPQEFEIPVKPHEHGDENYDQFLTHLYRHDELKRSRRMIVFRHDFLKKSPSV